MTMTRPPARPEPAPDEARSVPLAFPGASLHIARRHLLLTTGATLAVVSSAPYGGGWLRTKRILSSHVPKDVDCSEPEQLLERRAEHLGVAKPFVGLLTALDLRRAAIVEREEHGIAALVIVTAGAGNAANAARPAESARPEPIEGHTPAAPGTINTIVLLDAQPAPGAFVNVVLTATEAKTLAMVERGVRTSQGLTATGTSTDAIVIGATMRGAPHPYAGPATPLGALIGRAVYDATVRALRNNGDLLPERPPGGRP